MNDFLEDHLKSALQRKPAPEGFAERVIEKLPSGRRAGMRVWYGAVAAVLLAVLLYGAFGHARQQKVQQMAKARDTERQVVFALALAMEKVQHVNERLQRDAPKMRAEKRGEQL